MVKYKRSIVPEIEKEIAQEEEQKELKQKYNIQQEDVIVVEKNNILKYIIKYVVGAVKLVATVIILTLAVLGLLTLIYPESRQELAKILLDIYMQLCNYLPFLSKV